MEEARDGGGKVAVCRAATHRLRRRAIYLAAGGSSTGVGRGQADAGVGHGSRCYWNGLEWDGGDLPLARRAVVR